MKRLAPLVVALLSLVFLPIASASGLPTASWSAPSFNPLLPQHVGGVRATTSVAIPANDRLRPGMRLVMPRTYRGHRVVHYQWLRCNRAGVRCATIRGANHRVYVVRMADIGHTLRARVSSQVSVTAVTSPTAVVGRPAPVNTAPPTLSDNCAGATAGGVAGCLADPTATGAVVTTGDTLTGTTGTWTHVFQNHFTEQWFDCAPTGTTPPTTWTNTQTLDGLTCEPITGATTLTYLVADSDVGFDLVLQVTGYNF